MPQRPLILFVHGTWSTPKIWDWLEGHLRKDLPTDVDFRRLPWSGGNSAAARMDGVRQFEKAVEDCSGRPVFVICHSHGANLVLQATDRARNCVQLLICLNSPILTTKRLPTPWPIWVALLFVALMSFAVGLGWNVGLAIFGGPDPTYRVAGAIALTLLFFAIATTRWAFIVLVLFALIAAYLMMWRIAPHLRHPILYGILDVFTGSALLLVPVLTGYAYWSRWRFKSSIHPSAAVSVMVHIVAIDDEIFLLLGLALAIQRLIQLLVAPIYKSVRMLWPNPTMTLLAVGLGGTTMLAWWISAAREFEETIARYGGYIMLAVTAGVLIAATLIFVKLMLFGVAYGWDMAGISV